MYRQPFDLVSVEQVRSYLVHIWRKASDNYMPGDNPYIEPFPYGDPDALAQSETMAWIETQIKHWEDHLQA